VGRGQGSEANPSIMTPLEIALPAYSSSVECAKNI